MQEFTGRWMLCAQIALIARKRCREREHTISATGILRDACRHQRPRLADRPQRACLRAFVPVHALTAIRVCHTHANAHNTRIKVKIESRYRTASHRNTRTHTYIHSIMTKICADFARSPQYTQSWGMRRTNVRAYE